VYAGCLTTAASSVSLPAVVSSRALEIPSLHGDAMLCRPLTLVLILASFLVATAPIAAAERIWLAEFTQRRKGAKRF
jgi:hypothetical protein